MNKEPRTKNKERAKHALIALALFILTFVVYWISIPHKINTIPEFRNYFDSDGEFIVRQFRQGKTYTHNDHLLYHVAGKGLHDHGRMIPSVYQDPVLSHKLLSALAGALGVSLLYLLGLLLTGNIPLSGLSALLTGGCAGWWFFSSTIDTYLPCLTASIIALGFALLILEKPRLLYSGLLGAAVGLAFLLRTDSFLLIPLAIVFVKTKRDIWKHLLAAGLAGAFVGGLGYFVLAHGCYDVAWKDIPAWALGHLDRPEAGQEKIWGVAKNLTAANSRLVLVNQLFYTALLPDLDTTRNFRLHQTYVKGAWIPVLLYMATCLIAWWHLGRESLAAWKKRDWRFLALPLLACLWFLPRILFYTWWDPYDPFLFAVMTLPSLWLILIPGFDQALRRQNSQKKRIALLALLSLTTLAVWSHNLYYLVDPIRELCAG